MSGAAKDVEWLEYFQWMYTNLRARLNLAWQPYKSDTCNKFAKFMYLIL